MTNKDTASILLAIVATLAFFYVGFSATAQGQVEIQTKRHLDATPAQWQCSNYIALFTMFLSAPPGSPPEQQQ